MSIYFPRYGAFRKKCIQIVDASLLCLAKLQSFIPYRLRLPAVSRFCRVSCQVRRFKVPLLMVRLVQPSCLHIVVQSVASSWTVAGVVVRQ